ncbi:hypothetical protein [Acinetobacter sp. ANC 3813]|uniref:hypothetical protein n=1 Tax=Acinetobacter sp. ANC 3813 TaxID=1977873 RepID=UPI000A34D2F9|nr:hypothetical protein [Acinetobacter sp. ANC 3813]
MKAKILERILLQVQKKLGFKTIENIKVFEKKNYEYLKGRQTAKHILIDGTNIEIIEYSPDPREHPYYEYKFEYLDDFLLAYFSNQLNIISRAYTFKKFGAVGQNIDILEYINKNNVFKAQSEKWFLTCLSFFHFFILNLFVRFKVNRKEYLYYFTHITTLLAWFMLIIFWVLFFLQYSFPSLLFISGIFYLLNGYIRLEALLKMKKGGYQINFDTDRWIGVIGLVLLCVYMLYFYKWI